jgi:hypothetical protein
MTTTPSKRAPKKASSESRKPGTRRPKRSAPALKPAHEEIATRAYGIYLADGGGDDVAHWLRAERELSGS